MSAGNPLSWQNFKHIMKELQGAIIIGSAFQAILGYSGLMSIFLRYDSSIFKPQSPISVYIYFINIIVFLLLGNNQNA